MAPSVSNRVAEQGVQAPLSANAILHVGARLLGIFVVIQAVPDLIGKLGRTISGIQQLASMQDSFGPGVMGQTVFSTLWSSLVAPVLKLALGLVLVLKTDSVLNWIDRKEQKTEPSAAPLPSEGAPSEGR